MSLFQVTFSNGRAPCFLKYLYDFCVVRPPSIEDDALGGRSSRELAGLAV